MRPIVIILILVISLASGCGKDPNLDPNLLPGKSVLLFPAQDAACTTGTVISATQSDVTFNWNISENTENYEVVIKNLLSGDIITKNVTTNQILVTLMRNTPYSWYVVSKSTKTDVVTKSDVWKFYNSGPGVVFYAPFPATAVAPTNSQTITATNGLISISWDASSVDNNIIGYDLYFGPSISAGLYKKDITDMFLNNIPVTTGTTYYWKIITKDAAGNSSDSGVFQFKVN